MQAITTSGTIVAAKYDGGIILASDTTISYGSMFKYNNVSHFEEIAPKIILGGTGEFADFHALCEILRSEILEAQCKHNGEYLTPSEVHTYVKRIMYQKRSKMQPFATKVIVAGINPDGSSFLACTDPYGASWEDDTISTGFGRYLQGTQVSSVVGGPKENVISAIKEIFMTVFARHCQANGKVEFLDVTPETVTKLEPIKISPHWEIVEATWDE